MAGIVLAALTIFVACCREAEEVVSVPQQAQNGISRPVSALPGAGSSRRTRNFPRDLVPGAGIEPAHLLRDPGF